MGYDFECNDYYGYIVYHFMNGTQKVNIYLLNLEENSYRAVVWAEDGTSLDTPHKLDFQRTIYNVIEHFDDNRSFEYEIYAE